jgi:hypothetical protein
VLGDTLENMVLHNMELSLKDDGFLNRAINAYAAQSGQDPQELRNQLTGMLAMAPMMAAGSGIDPELLTEASTALSSFVSDPKTLTIKLAPAEPLVMSDACRNGRPVRPDQGSTRLLCRRTNRQAFSKQRRAHPSGCARFSFLRAGCIA